MIQLILIENINNSFKIQILEQKEKKWIRLPYSDFKKSLGYWSTKDFGTCVSESDVINEL